MLYSLYTPGPIPTHHPKMGKFDPNTFDRISKVQSMSERETDLYDYRWNSDKLRSIEFSEKPNIIALGCSITFGIGLPVEATWPMLLQEKLKEHGDFSIGTIAYSGGSIMKSISSFFGMINKYDYVPEYVICNFPNLERFMFIDPEYNSMMDYLGNYLINKKTVARAPFEYDKILPFEWIYYINLEYIKMLEVFCKQAGVKLIWSTWSKSLMEERDQFFDENFKYYIKDPTREIFPTFYEPGADYATNEKELNSKYSILTDSSCHSEHSDLEYFNHALDRYPVNGYMDPHPGLHRHLHWAELYYDEVLKTLV